MIRLHVNCKPPALEQAPVPEEVEEHEIDMDDVQEKNHAHIYTMTFLGNTRWLTQYA
jgi:hypothetical protein